MKWITFLFCFYPLCTYSWNINGVTGVSFCEDKSIVLRFGEELPAECKINTARNSGIELISKDKKSQIVVGESSIVQIFKDKIVITNGRLRVEGDRDLTILKNDYVVKRLNGKQLFFSSKVFNDFELVSLSETVNFLEQIMDKNKDFNNLKTKIPPGQWVSVGGRFKDELGDFYNLNENQLKFFSDSLSPQKTLKEYRE